MVVLQIAIIVFTLIAAYKDLSIRRREHSGGVSAEVNRGKESMTAIYTMYGATIASCLVLIDNAAGIEGHKVILIVIDFLSATYVFFLSTWFRNAIFFPLMRRVQKD
jgi:ABC-type transport system involved in Fe-S cluster assembly fused permease/ATPase subunit